MPEQVVADARAAPATLPPRRRALGVRDQVGRRARARATPSPGRLRFDSRNLQRHHAALSRAGAAQPRAELAPRDPRRRDRRLRRATAGRASSALQRRMHLDGARRRCGGWPRRSPVTYVIFDLLWLDGHSLMDLPYEERRALLAELELDGDALADARTTSSATARGVLAATREQGLEGVVAKRLDCRVRAGPAQPRLGKVKNVDRQELVIGGWLPGEGQARATASARCSSACATSDGDAALRRPRRHRLHRGRARPARRSCSAPLERDTLAVRRRPDRRRRARRVFVEPRAASPRSSSASGRSDGHAARAVLQGPARGQGAGGRRPRRRPATAETARRRSSVAASTAASSRSRTSTRSCIRRPGFTKRDVIDYYAAIAPVAAAAPRGPPADAQALPQRRRGQVLLREAVRRRTGPTWVHDRARADGLARRSTSCVVRRPRDARLARATSPTSSCTRRSRRADDIRPPDDDGLRPRPGRAGDDRRVLPRSALLLRGHVRAASGCRAFAKTSGSKGLQVYVPLNTRDVTYDDDEAVRQGGRRAARARGSPSSSSRAMTKTLRKGKVLVDWSQNDEHKTTVSVYSLRARERPTVSTPLDVGRGPRVRATPATRSGSCSTPTRSARASRSTATCSRPVLSLVQQLPAV